MKKNKITYWIVTGIFAAFMIFTAIPDIMVAEDAVKMVSAGLGYPKYFLPFIGVAKLIGSIAILIPGFNSIKEWAYAGLFFDLIGAAYSMIATGDLQWSMLFMILPISLLFVSYFLWHKKTAIV